MKLKSIIATALAVSMFAAMLPAASAASFPDVEPRHSWAQTAIDDMASRGILKGFPDGNFKPDTPITKLDSLIITARILGYSDESNQKYTQAALECFAPNLASYDINYKGEVAYLLYWGVLKLDELDKYIANSTKSQPLLRHEAAILLTKLMGAEEEAKGSALVVLDYADDNTIPAASKPYVKYVSDKGVMNGMENSNFVPFNEVTRAMTATMMFRAEQAMELDYSDLTVVTTNSSDNTISAKRSNGRSVTVNVPASALIKIDGNNSTLSSLPPDVNIRVFYQNDQVRLIEAVSSDIQKSASGNIEGTSTSGGGRYISLIPSGSDEVIQYPVAEDCTFTVDGEGSSFAAMRQSMYIRYTIEGGKLTNIEAETKSKDYSGTITKVDVGSQVTVTIEVSDGTTHTYGFSDNATIKRNGESAEAWSLAKGDSVTYSVLYDQIRTLTATSKNRTVEGTIESIEISSSPSITIKIGNDEETYSINSNTSFVIDNKEGGTIYDLRIGAAVSLRLESNSVATVTTQSSTSSPVLVGVVSYIHPTSKVMGIDVTNADGSVTTVQAVVKSTVKITDATATKITNFKDIEVGRSVVAVGTMNYGVHEITSITITE